MLTSYLGTKSLKGQLYKKMQKQSSLLRTQKFQHLVLNPLKGKRKKDIYVTKPGNGGVKTQQRAVSRHFLKRRLPAATSSTFTHCQILDPGTGHGDRRRRGNWLA